MEITREDVQEGDIILMPYIEEENDWLILLGQALLLLEMIVGIRKFEKDQLIKLIKYLITLFSGSPYYHAALVTSDERGTLCVMEAGKGGVTMKHTLSAYVFPNIEIYRSKAIANGLPSKPVNDRALSLLDPHIKYAEDNLWVLAIWCLYRRVDGDLINGLKDILEELLPKEAVDRIFGDIDEEALTVALDYLFQTVLSQARDKTKMVCSAMVADCFNHAETDKNENAYHISLARDKATDVASRAIPPQELHGTIESLSNLAVKAALDFEVPANHESIKIDSSILYSPGDIGWSESTSKIGHLV